MNNQYNIKVQIPPKNAYAYDILIGENLLAKANEIVKSYTKANKFLIVTNTTIAKLYKESLNIKNAVRIILPDGEEYKNFDSLKKILDAAVENKFERKDCIIAFGGGVVGDISGFAAATYMRGCDFIQIPTTLLAQVDSSVGGKVAINHEHGKNLIGAFYQPKLVITDISVLKTLDLRQLKTGLAEILKYAFIEKSCKSPLNYRLFDFLKQNKELIYDLNPHIIAELVNICCSLKACVVNEDETEKGLRAILNLGHTFAHAIENLTHYTVYTHGEAVAAGLKMAFELAFNKNLIEKNYYQKAMELIENYDIIPVLNNFNKEEFYTEMLLDKKATDGKIRFVLPTEEGKVKIFNNILKEDVFEVIK